MRSLEITGTVADDGTLIARLPGWVPRGRQRMIISFSKAPAGARPEYAPEVEDAIGDDVARNAAAYEAVYSRRR